MNRKTPVRRNEMKIGNYMSKRVQEIFVRFLHGEWGEWKAFSELMLASVGELENEYQQHATTARVIWAARTMGQFKKEKGNLEGDKDE